MIDEADHHHHCHNDNDHRHHHNDDDDHHHCHNNNAHCHCHNNNAQGPARSMDGHPSLATIPQPPPLVRIFFWCRFFPHPPPLVKIMTTDDW